MTLDFDLDFLKAAVALIDENLERLDRETITSHDPDAFGIYDEIEYIAGFGFVACQTYVTAVVGRSKYKNKKQVALMLGPKHRSGQPMTQLINAAANHWKHNPEWSLDTPSSQAKRTLEVISSIGVDINGSYPIANLLHEMLTPHPARFANLIPFMAQWREEVMK